MIKQKRLQLTLFIGLTYSLTFGQVQTPTSPTPNQFMPENVIPMPTVPQPTNFTPQSIFNQPKAYSSPTDPMNVFQGTNEQERIRRQNQQLIQEVERNEQRRIEVQRQLYADLKMKRANFGLPSKSHIPETAHYRKAFDSLTSMNPDSFSLKKATFIIENAYFDEQQDYSEFEKTVKETGDFLRKKMGELGYNQNSNLAKNLILFQFFSDTLETKGIKHLPFKYDFEDYRGDKDLTKIFVSKLLRTGSGQCNSLPRLYLILAEEIGAEAFLALSPNHSYIKFKDEDENWYNVELTNGMFTADSYILQSGYIKSEALVNGIYMKTLTSKEHMAVLLANLAIGYEHKFGNDPFVLEIANKALDLAPNQLNAHMIKATLLAEQFERAAHQIGVNPRDNRDLQNIRFHPPIVKMLDQANAQNRKIDNLGYEYMPATAYEKWLDDLMDAKQQQDNEKIKQQFNIKRNQLKN